MIMQKKLLYLIRASGTAAGLAATFAIVAGSTAHAQLRVEISGVGANQIPIAIAAFADESIAPQQVSAIIKADRSKLKAFDKPVDLLPGMTASVEIRTGQRSVLGFLLRPLVKTQEAFRER